MRRNGWYWLVAGCAALGMAVSAPAEEAEVSPVVLRHAVTCPPFKGEPELARLYHEQLVDLLRACEGIEYIEGSWLLTRRGPEFAYRVNGSIVENEEGQRFVTVAVVDTARKETIASHMAPASTDPDLIAAWKRTIQSDIQRRVSRMPFECRLRRQRGQNSFTLDRGLSAGLQPGMRMHVSRDDEVLLSPMTGEVIGREALRPIGQIEIFRVMDTTAYARPVDGTQLVRPYKLYAWTF